MENKVVKMVTDRIIADLENGVIPWEKPMKIYAVINHFEGYDYIKDFVVDNID